MIGCKQAEIFEYILNQGLKLRVKVTGRSMTPFLADGDTVTIKPASADSLQRGDLIFYRDRFGLAVLHRLVAIKQTVGGRTVFQTKGDALLYRDDPIDEHQILGKVCAVEKMNRSGIWKYINTESYLWKIINAVWRLGLNVNEKLHSRKSSAISGYMSKNEVDIPYEP